MRTFDEIARRLQEADSGELRDAESYGKPLPRSAEPA